MDLALSWSTRRIADTKLKQVRVLVDKHVDERTLSYFIVTFPTPDAPVMIKGLSRLMSLV